MHTLDIVAPMKTFSIKPKYIHGLTDEAKQLNLVENKTLLGNEETQLTKLLKPIRTHDPDQNPP